MAKKSNKEEGISILKTNDIMLEKHKRWENKAYTRWVATHECAACGLHDETISPHHLRHIYSKLSGGTSYKASDWLTMPLCYTCHNKLHNGSRWLIDYQPFMILSTLDKAIREGIIAYKPKLFGEDLND